MKVSFCSLHFEPIFTLVPTFFELLFWSLNFENLFPFSLYCDLTNEKYLHGIESAHLAHEDYPHWNLKNLKPTSKALWDFPLKPKELERINVEMIDWNDWTMIRSMMEKDPWMKTLFPQRPMRKTHKFSCSSLETHSRNQ